MRSMADNANDNSSTPLASDSYESSQGAHSITSSRLDRQYSKEQRPVSQRAKEPLLKLWWFEILAACFSVACVACMIALLGSIHGKPYEPWHAFGTSITPNTLLAILSTFSKSSLLLAVAQALGQLKWIYFQQRAHRLFDLQAFDEASRGPLGALKLVWTIKTQAIVASIGAIIVVLSMAMDPFTQQILSFPTARTNLTNSTAHIGSAQGFGLVYYLSDSKDVVINYNIKLQDAVTFGILSDEAILPRYNCSTGDCHWPRFRTLGVCNKCLNVSSQLDVECKPKIKPNLIPSAQKEYHSKTCVYTFPERQGVQVISANDDIPDGRYKPNITWTADTQGDFTTWDRWNKSVDVYSTDQSTMYNKVTTGLRLPQIATVEQAKWRSKYYGHIETASEWQHIGHDLMPQAVQCYLYWCEQTHETSEVKAGVLYDASTSNKDLQVGFAHIGLAEGASEGMYPAWPVDRAHPSNSSLDDTNLSNEASDIYWIDPEATTGLGYSLGYTFGGLSVMGNDAQYLWYESSAISNRIYYGDLPTILDQVAASLTSTLRNLNHTRTINGTVIQPVTHVRVNWYWLIYPGILVLLAASFLIISIAFSAEREGIVWKTSILPLIFHRGDDYEGRDVPSSGIRELENTARATQARLLDRDGCGPTLRFHPHEANGA